MRDRRLSNALHALLHLGEHDGAMTSEHMAACLRTNPVVVRRLLGGLRDAGLVAALKGPGGGWKLARALERISIADVYAALDLLAVPARAAKPKPQCLIEQAVARRVAAAQSAAEAVFSRRLASISLHDIANDYKRPAGRRRTRRTS